MRGVLGYILYLLAIVITVAVVIAKYNLMALPEVPVLTGFVSADHARALLAALLLSFIARWV